MGEVRRSAFDIRLNSYRVLFHKSKALLTSTSSYRQTDGYTDRWILPRAMGGGDRLTVTDEGDSSGIWEAGDTARSLAPPWCPWAGHLLCSRRKIILKGLMGMKPGGISRQS